MGLEIGPCLVEGGNVYGPGDECKFIEKTVKNALNAMRLMMLNGDSRRVKYTFTRVKGSGTIGDGRSGITVDANAGIVSGPYPEHILEWFAALLDALGDIAEMEALERGAWRRADTSTRLDIQARDTRLLPTRDKGRG